MIYFNLQDIDAALVAPVGKFSPRRFVVGMPVLGKKYKLLSRSGERDCICVAIDIAEDYFLWTHRYPYVETSEKSNDEKGDAKSE